MENQSMKQTGEGKTCCSCGCHGKGKTGAALIVFGALFLLQALGAVSAHFVSIVWPIIVLLFGCKFLCRCCHSMSGCGH